MNSRSHPTLDGMIDDQARAYFRRDPEAPLRHYEEQQTKRRFWDKLVLEKAARKEERAEIAQERAEAAQEKREAEKRKAKQRAAEMQRPIDPVTRLIRLEPRLITDYNVPWHPDFATVRHPDRFGEQGSHISVNNFLKKTLSQANKNITSFVHHISTANDPYGTTDHGIDVKAKPKWVPVESNKKTGPHKINLFSRRLPPTEFSTSVTGTESDSSDALQGTDLDYGGKDVTKQNTEYWAARSSMHVNDAASGTASVSEFYSGIKQNHSENEAEFTPTIKWANKVLEWPVSDLTIRGDIASTTFTDISFGLYEMYHRLPFFCQDRIFPFLLVTAKVSETELIVVSLPVKGTEILPKSKIRRSGAIIGRYVAMERVRIVDAGNGKDEMIEWVMATASDARGWLPMFLQKPKVPGEIAKDVKYFLDWTEKRRGTATDGSHGATADNDTAKTDGAKNSAAKGLGLRGTNTTAALQEGWTPGDGAGG